MNPKVTPADKAIARTIYDIRASIPGLSQRRVADFLEVAYQSYQKMETGKVSFRASTLLKLSALFGVPVTKLVEADGNGFSPDPQWSDLAAVFQSLPKERRGEAVETLRRMRGQ